MTSRFTATMVASVLCVGLASSVGAQSIDRDAEIQRRIASLEAQLAELKALVAQRGAEPVVAEAAAPNAQPAKDPSDALAGVKFGIGLDTYYDFNFNRPIGRVNLLRAYDVTANNFSLNQANVILESPPNVDAGRRFGARVDFQYGQATETLQGSSVNEPRPWVYRNIFQAYGTYVLPVGSGMSVDFGKWASSLGPESNYSKDQNNYSRSYWFNFLPFYHMGVHANYKVSEKVALNYSVVNGTEQTEAFNNFKDQFLGVLLTPTKNLSWNVQYYLGQEHPDVVEEQTPVASNLPTQAGLSITPVVPYYRGKLNIFDTYATWQAAPTTSFMLEGDYVVNQNQAPTSDARVYGGAVYARRQLTKRTTLAGRAEFLRDRGGLFTGATQSINEATVTYDFRPSIDGFLIRTEWRRDDSNIPFFLTNTAGGLKHDQQTATVGVMWWWGNKQGGW